MALRRSTTPKKSKSRPKPKPGEEILFSRDNGKRVPVKVQDAADLWLELFTNIAGMTALDPESNAGQSHKREWLDDAAELADHALFLYEDRWPHMAHGTEG